jgi:hypothetical protein
MSPVISSLHDRPGRRPAGPAGQAGDHRAPDPLPAIRRPGRRRTLRSCYLPGATEDHGGLFAGPAQEYIDSITASLTHPRARTSHNLTNLLIEVDGDTATAGS